MNNITGRSSLPIDNLTLGQWRTNHRQDYQEKENYQQIMNITSTIVANKQESQQMNDNKPTKNLSFRETMRLTSHRPPISSLNNRLRRNTLYGRMTHREPESKQEEPVQKEIDTLYSDPAVLASYQILSHIGKGSYAVVSSAIEKSTQRNFAIKIYERMAIRDPQRLENVKRQIKNLKQLRHRNIVGLVHAIYDKKKIYLIMENAGKSSLHSLLRRKQLKRFSEAEARHYLKQILSAMAHCHRQGICHRDIKLENILVNEANQIKLIDFGFSINNKSRLSTYCGTPSYMAPQIAAKSSYEGWQVDIWSCGVLLYVMLCGTYPFRGMDEKELYRKIRSGKYTFREELNISLGAKRIIGKMLKIIPSSRLPAQELLFDKWFDE